MVDDYRYNKSRSSEEKEDVVPVRMLHYDRAYCTCK